MYVRDHIVLPAFTLSSCRASLSFVKYSFPTPLRVGSYVSLGDLVKILRWHAQQRWSPILVLTGLDVE